MITMLLGGLWHGAGWTFVVWGFLYGVALIVEHIRVDRRKQRALHVRRQRLELAAAFDGLTEAPPAAAGEPAVPATAPALEYDRQPWHGVWLPRVGVFAFVTFAWIFFRSDSFAAALGVIARLFQSWGTVGVAVTPGVFLAIAVGIGVQYVPRSWWQRGEAGLSTVNPVLQGVVLAVGFMLLDILGADRPGGLPLLLQVLMADEPTPRDPRRSAPGPPACRWPAAAGRGRAAARRPASRRRPAVRPPPPHRRQRARSRCWWRWRWAPSSTRRR